MELMCDRVGIIANGKLIEVRSAAELSRTDKSEHIYRFTVSDSAKAAEVAEGFADIGISIVHKTPQYLDIKLNDTSEINIITLKIINSGVTLLGVTRQERTLEDAFIEITKGGGQIA
jgi:ABC-2 type transport system ATP-binding protein